MKVAVRVGVPAGSSSALGTSSSGWMFSVQRIVPGKRLEPVEVNGDGISSISSPADDEVASVGGSMLQ